MRNVRAVQLREMSGGRSAGPAWERHLLAGSIGALISLVLVGLGVAHAATPPSNDAFRAATEVSAYPFTDSVDLGAASVEVDEPAGYCAPAGPTRSAWYEVTAPATGVVVAAVTASKFADHVLAWYRSTGPAISDLSFAACRSAIPTSAVRVQPGTTYYLQVSDAGSGGGEISLSFTFYLPPPNDAVADAAVVPRFPWSDTVDLWAATFDAAEPNACALPVSRRTAWYRFDAAESGKVTVTATGFEGSQLAVYGPDGGTCADVGAALAFTVVPGSLYLVEVANGTTTFGTLDVTFAFASGPPNDDFGHATTITAASLPFSDAVDISGATLEPLERDPCNWGMTRSAWYSIVPAESIVLTVDLGASEFADPRLTYYVGLGSPGLGGLSSGRCGTSTGPVTTITLSAGRTYYLQVSDAGSGGGTARIRVAPLPPPPNDGLLSAAVVSALPFAQSVDTRGATLEGGEPRPCGGSSRTVWYRYTPAEAGVVTVSTTGSSSPSTLTVYRSSGTGFGGLAGIGCQPSGWSLVVRLQAGVVYYVQAADAALTGTLVLSLTSTPGATPVLPNDAFGLARNVDALPFADTVDLSTATLEPGESGGGCGNYFAGSAWYRLTAPADGAITLAGTSSTGPVLLNVWRAGATPGIGGLQSLGVNACSQVFPVEAGATYYIQAASVVYTTPGVLELHVSMVPRPPNDDLAGATVVTGNPFEDSVDLRAATPQPDEPHHCGGTARTVWYAFTAPATGRLLVGAGGLWDPVVAIYRSTGPGFGALDLVGCAYVADGPISVGVERGATFLVQLSDWYSGGAVADVRLEFASRTSVTITGVEPLVAVDARVAIDGMAADEVDGPLAPSCTLTNDGTGAVVSEACTIGAWAWELGTGSFTLTVTASNSAGDVTRGSARFDVVATYPSMIVLTRQWVWKAGVGRDLAALLDGAALAEARGKLKAEAARLADFRALLRAQAGKSIAPADADRLIAFSYGL